MYVIPKNSRIFKHVHTHVSMYVDKICVSVHPKKKFAYPCTKKETQKQIRVSVHIMKKNIRSICTYMHTYIYA